MELLFVPCIDASVEHFQGSPRRFVCAREHGVPEYLSWRGPFVVVALLAGHDQISDIPGSAKGNRLEVIEIRRV